MKQLELPHLVNANSAIVNDLFGRDFAEASGDDALSAGVVMDANHTLADYLYGTEIAAMIRAKKITSLDAMSEENLEAVTQSNPDISRIDSSQVGIVLVRPEAAEIADDYHAMLAGKKLQIVYSKNTSVNFSQYWGMYHHGLIHPDSYQDFPTRTLNYVDKPLHLIVVTATDETLQGKSVSEYLYSFKGKQGMLEQGTLRGDLGFTALRACLDPTHTDRFVATTFAIGLDPIGSYRHLVRGDIPSDGMHDTADVPLLFYAGQSVHVPDDTEVKRDLSILCSDEEIDSIAETIQTYRSQKNMEQ